MKLWVMKPLLNETVTSFYLDRIADAYRELGLEIIVIHTWKNYKPRRDDLTIVSTSVDALVPLLRHQRYIWWIQGTWPEENYYKKHSKVKFYIISQIEKMAIKGASFIFYVSESMKKHYEKKYNIDTSDISYIMPCSNEVMHPECFVDDRYKNNIFCYAGSISSWQCIDQTLDIYKKIETVAPGSKLLMLVKDREKAISMIQERGIKNYEIDFVRVEQLVERMKDVKYGFIIREDEIFNRVATPTKLSTYMANGIIPIYSDCLDGLNEVIGDSEYVVKMKNIEDISPILCSVEKTISARDVYRDFLNHFDRHYNAEVHHINMMDILPT